MKTKNLISLFLLAFMVILQACTTLGWPPKGISYKYDGKYTGIDTLVNINGFYMSKKSFPSGNETFSYYNHIFYPDGLVCFFHDDNPLVSFNNGSIIIGTWGNYIISGDTIKCQFFMRLGLMGGGIVVAKTNLLIVNKNRIDEIDKDNNVEYEFHPLESRIDSTNWLLDKKWFYKKKKKN